MKTPHLEDASQIIAKYDFRILSGANYEIQLTAMLAELSKFSK
jgi:replication factor C small subunit